MKEILIIGLVLFWFTSNYAVQIETTNNTINQIASFPKKYKLLDLITSMISNNTIDENDILKIKLVKN